MGKHRIGIAVLLILALAALTGCDPSSSSYEGPHRDLNSEATNSMLGVYGEFFAQIAVVEEDEYGRVLYLYRGESTAADDTVYGEGAHIFAILVAQGSDGKYVYYYPDVNFALYEDALGSMPTEEDMLAYAGDTAFATDILQLKRQNDWGRPMDNNKCVRARISKLNRDLKNDLELVPEQAQADAYAQVAPREDYSLGCFDYLTSDDYDRHIFFFRVRDVSEEDAGATAYKESYVVLFHKDGSFDPEKGIMEITDLWDYQDDLKAFKERNGWNTPV